MPQLPGPVRAALGLVATVVDGERSLPDRALELPVLAVSTALQLSLRAQQRYATLTAKGDEFLSQLRGAPDEPPSWARFDDDEPPVPPPFDDEPDDDLLVAELAVVAEVADIPPAAPLPKSGKDAVKSSKAPVKAAGKRAKPAKATSSTRVTSAKRKPSAFDEAAIDEPTDDPIEAALDELPDLEGFSIPPASEG